MHDSDEIIKCPDCGYDLSPEMVEQDICPCCGGTPSGDMPY